MAGDQEELMSIGELAKESGRSVHTLRYYEDEGLIPRVRRNRSGHRRYTRDHLDWMKLLDRLRASGMPIARMREYAGLVEEGSGSAGERIELLREHEADVEERIEELEDCLRVIRAKVAFYRELQEDDEAVWSFPG